jgi:hypothetical protein
MVECTLIMNWKYLNGNDVVNMLSSRRVLRGTSCVLPEIRTERLMNAMERNYNLSKTSTGTRGRM